MKKTIFMLLAMFITCGVWAQEGNRQRREFNPEDMATRRTENLQKKLDLDTAQYKKVYTLYLEQANEMKARMEKMRESGERPQMGQPGGEPSEEMKKQMEEMKKRQDDFDAKIKGILTEEQYAKYEKMDRRGGFGGGRGQRQGGNN